MQMYRVVSITKSRDLAFSLEPEGCPVCIIVYNSCRHTDCFFVRRMAEMKEKSGWSYRIMVTFKEIHNGHIQVNP